MTLLLNRRTMKTVLDWPSVIAAVERGFIELAAGHVTQPVRTVLRSATMRGAYVLMPCSIEGTPVLGAKIATIYPANRLRGLPTIAALYALTDFETGQMLAIMDAGYMTAVRTAAASIVATMRLAREDAKSLGLFGTGTQAEFHARGFAAAMPQLRLKVLGTSPDKTRGFVERLNTEAIRAEPASSAIEIARCDVIVTATSATRPLFDGRTLRSGTHINGVGSHTPTTRELDSETIVRSRLVADSRDAVFAEAGDVLIPIEEGRIGRDHVIAELGEVLSGAKSGRLSAEDITLFKSNGIAFQDVMTADIAYRRAQEKGFGQEFDFDA